MLELKWNKSTESYNDFCARIILNYKEYGFNSERECFLALTDTDMKDNSRKYKYSVFNIQKAVEEGYADKFAINKENINHKDLNSLYKNDEMIKSEDAELFLNKIKKLEKQLQTSQDNLRIARADNRKGYRTENVWEKFLLDFKNIEPIRLNPSTKEFDGKKVAVLNIADCHYGMKFESVLNIYNKDVAIERMKTLTKKTLELLSRDYKLVILQLGDNISGNIHVSTRIDSDMDVVESTKVFTESMLGAISEFCEYFSEVEYYSVHGNHERVLPSKEESLEKENFTNFSDWYIRLATRDISNFKFKTNRIYGIAEYEVFDKKMVALHGHQVSIKNVSSVAHTVGYIPNQIQLAHFHTLNIKDHGRTRVVVNPSFCGIDSYASGKLLYGKPHQLLEVFYDNGDKETKELYL